MSALELLSRDIQRDLKDTPLEIRYVETSEAMLGALAVYSCFATLEARAGPKAGAGSLSRSETAPSSPGPAGLGPLALPFRLSVDIWGSSFG